MPWKPRPRAADREAPVGAAASLAHAELFAHGVMAVREHRLDVELVELDLEAPDRSAVRLHQAAGQPREGACPGVIREGRGLVRGRGGGSRNRQRSGAALLVGRVCARQLDVLRNVRFALHRNTPISAGRGSRGAAGARHEPPEASEEPRQRSEEGAAGMEVSGKGVGGELGQGGSAVSRDRAHHGGASGFERGVGDSASAADGDRNHAWRGREAARDALVGRRSHRRDRPP